MLSPQEKVQADLYTATLTQSALSLVGLPPASSCDPFKRIGVVGAGMMGTGIATCFLISGRSVTLIDASADALGSAASKIEKNLSSLAARGRVATDQVQRNLELLTVNLDLNAVANSELVIDTVPEKFEIKAAVFRQLDRLTPAATVLASNTSSLNIDVLADSTRRPAQVLGTHFFSPAHLMPLVEIVRGRHTGAQLLADMVVLFAQLNKVAVVCGVCDGFVGNRMFEEYLRQAYFLLDEGALPWQVDCALEDWGFAMGPFKVMDMVGQDIGWEIRQRRKREQPHRPYSAIPDLICELGRFGQKACVGFYLYPEGSRAPVDDPQIQALVESHSSSIGLKRRTIGPKEIAARCTLALINEGANILDEKIARGPAAINAVYLHGYGFPIAQGGPMVMADRRGLSNVVARIREFQTGYQGWAWKSAELLMDLARSHRDFGTFGRIASAAETYT